MGFPHLTFYGHFSGLGSYSIVCEQLSAFLERAGVEHTRVDLREWDRIGKRYVAPGGPALLFGFPGWWNDIWHATRERPHEPCIGYHVCDVLPAPPAWAPIVNRLDACIVASRWGEAALLAGGVTAPIFVVKHGVPCDMPLVPPPPPEDAETFLHFCSSQDPARKGTVSLIDAFSKLDRGKLRIYSTSGTVELFAKTSTRREAIELLKDSPVPTQQAQVERFACCMAVVQPSRAEGFGMIVGDALAAGVPVVATTCTGHAETLSPWPCTPGLVPVLHGALTPCSGGLAPEVHPDDILAALETMLDERALQRELAGDAEHRQALLDGHEWAAVLDQFLYVLQVVVS